MRVLARLCILTLGGLALATASCSSTGFAGNIYMSPDSDGKRTQSAFYEDNAETPAIYLIVPIVSGKNDETVTVKVKVKSVFGQDVSKVYNPFLVADIAPGIQTKPSKLSVQFPDPPPIEVPNPADPTTPLSQPQNRAVGKYQFIVTMNGETQTVNFDILGETDAFKPPTDPNAGTPQQRPPPGGCSVQTVFNCPPPVNIDPSAHPDLCCTATGDCGIGIEGTGLCDPSL